MTLDNDPKAHTLLASDLLNTLAKDDLENNFKPKYVIPTKAKKVAKELKDAMKKSDLVILATDEDREGEAIAWHILQNFTTKAKTKNYQRIAFHEITKSAIEKSVRESS